MPDPMDVVDDFMAQRGEAVLPDYEVVAPPAENVTPTPQAPPVVPTNEETFFDPAALPPELQGAYKGMQAAFTKKMQDLSADRQKAQLFDSLLQNPATKAAILGSGGAPPAEAQPSPASYFQHTQDEAKAYEGLDASGKGALSFLEKKVMGSVMTVMERALQQIAPKLQQFEEFQGASRTEQALAKYPGAAEKKAEIVALAKRYPDLTMEQVVGAVLGPNHQPQNNGGGTPQGNNPPRPTLSTTRGSAPARGAHLLTPDQVSAANEEILARLMGVSRR